MPKTTNQELCRHPEITACLISCCSKTGKMIIGYYRCEDCKKTISAKDIEVIPPSDKPIKLFAIQS